MNLSEEFDTSDNVEVLAPTVVKSKRGRKSKKELMESLNLLNIQEQPTNQHSKLNTTLDKIGEMKKQIKKNNDKIKNNKNEINKNETNKNENKVDVKNSEIIENSNKIINESDNANEDETTENGNSIENNKPTENGNNTEIKVFKKRGRKPKGGKIIQQTIEDDEENEEKQYVILHLKCSMLDLENVNEENQNSLDAYNTHIYNDYCQPFDENKIPMIQNETADTDTYDADNDDTDTNDSRKENIKEIWKKLKQLESNLHMDNISKKSSCFWDTCDFDTPPVHIPKYFINGTYHVYGCFCCPECAIAYLNNQHIDRSTKTERKQLLHDIYSKIYGYTKSIKEASDPRYLLDKFLGNLTIKEYRLLLKTETLYLVIDKPLTKVYPEIHEDTDDYILNSKIIPSNTSSYQIRGKNGKRKANKSSILSENFGIN